MRLKVSIPGSEPLLTAAQVAELFGVTECALKFWRVRGRGPESLNKSGRVYYAREEIIQYVESGGPWNRASGNPSGKRKHAA